MKKLTEVGSPKARPIQTFSVRTGLRAGETTSGSDNFQTTSPGHKTVGEITLR